MPANLEDRIALDELVGSIRADESVLELRPRGDHVRLGVLQAVEAEVVAQRKQAASRRLDVRIEAVNAVRLEATENEQDRDRTAPP